MDKVLLFVLTAGVLGAAAAVSASIYFLIKRKRFWRRALTAAMLAELAASSGAMGLTWFCILMEDFEPDDFRCIPYRGGRVDSGHRSVGNRENLGETVGW